MTSLRQIAEDYLAIRRSLGYRLVAHGRLLGDYIGALEATGADTVTIANAVAWATQPTSASSIWWTCRLSVVRCFARHLSAIDPQCQVPPTDLLPAGNARTTPYIYSEAEIDALVHAAGTIAQPMHAASCQAVISLLASSGMRIGEVISLARNNVDLKVAVLTVVDGKYGAARYVPLHPSTAAMLRRYATRRDRLCPSTSRTDRFFISSVGTPLIAGLIEQTFTRLLVQAQIAAPAGQRRPRIHDLRHYAEFRVSATRLPSPPCGTGTATESISRPISRCCRPCSDTSHRPPRTGI